MPTSRFRKLIKLIIISFYSFCCGCKLWYSLSTKSSFSKSGTILWLTHATKTSTKTRHKMFAKIAKRKFFNYRAAVLVLDVTHYYQWKSSMHNCLIFHLNNLKCFKNTKSYRNMCCCFYNIEFVLIANCNVAQKPQTHMRYKLKIGFSTVARMTKIKQRAVARLT